MSIEPLLIERLTQPFFAQGESVVYAAECCGKVLVTVIKPERCSSCSRVPEVLELRPPEAG